MLEKVIQQRVVNFLKKEGWVAVRSLATSSGDPDYSFKKNNLVFYIEFKAPGKKVGYFQALKILKLRETGFPVAIIDNWDSFLDFYKTIKA